MLPSATEQILAHRGFCGVLSRAGDLASGYRVAGRVSYRIRAPYGSGSSADAAPSPIQTKRCFARDDFID